MNIALLSGTIPPIPSLTPAPANHPSNTLSTPFGKTLPTTFHHPKHVIQALPRHGTTPRRAPHTSPFQANTYAEALLDIDLAIALYAVGSLTPDLPPTSISLPADYIDTAPNPIAQSLIDGPAHPHTPPPQYAALAFDILGNMKDVSHRSINDIYLQIPGPTFNTRAESHHFRQTTNATIVGMTYATEAKLHAAASIPLLAICAVTDMDAWHHPRATSTTIRQAARQNVATLQALLTTLLDELPTAPPENPLPSPEEHLLCDRDVLSHSDRTILDALMRNWKRTQI